MRISDWSSDVCSSDLTHADFVFDPEITARQGNQAQAPEIFDTASEEGLLAILIRHDEFDRREKLLLKEGGGSMNGLVDFLKFQNLLGRHVDQDRKSTRLNSSH